jgi:hypothetical protein
MSTIGGPATVTSGLVLELDAGNIKSYQSGSTTWFDKSGNANNGTLINGPTFNTGSLGSIVFDGVNDYADLGTNLNYTSTGSAFTVDMWISSNINLSNSPNYYGLISNISTISGVEGFQLFWGGPDDSLYAFGTNYLARTTTNITGLTANIWYNITFIYVRNTSGNIYLNGVNQTSISYNNTINTPLQPLKLGVRADSNTFPWNGRMSSIKLYNRALSTSEVQQNFNATRARFGI